mgnify:CR=1 FL=1
MKNQLERIEDYANSLERVVLNDEEQMLLLIGGVADVITVENNCSCFFIFPHSKHP